MKRYINPEKIDLRLGALEADGEILLPLSAVRAAIAAAPSEDVVELPRKDGFVGIELTANHEQCEMTKQIDEMAKAICRYYESDKYSCGRCPDCYARDEAKKLYNADFRKQSEGEWLSTTNITISERGRRINSTLYVCSACRKSNGRRKTNYCPNCGAKMKGGADG